MSQPYVGEIRMFAGNFAPAGWAFCDGQLLPISENDTLFNLIGTTYGGDGQSTFALPNLQSRVPMHMGTQAGGTYVIGEMAGAEQATLTVTQIPAHTHTPLANSVGSATSSTNNVWANSSAIQFNDGSTVNTTMNPNSLASVGGSQPHDNMIPFLGINFIISLFGVFPSQT